MCISSEAIFNEQFSLPPSHWHCKVDQFVEQPLHNLLSHVLLSIIGSLCIDLSIHFLLVLHRLGTGIADLHLLELDICASLLGFES